MLAWLATEHPDPRQEMWQERANSADRYFSGVIYNQGINTTRGRPFEVVLEPLTARQHERLRSPNSPSVWRAIFQREISIERGVKRNGQQIGSRCDSATMARETATGRPIATAITSSNHYHGRASTSSARPVPRFVAHPSAAGSTTGELARVTGLGVAQPFHHIPRSAEIVCV